MNIGGVDHTRMLFRAECAVVPALVSRGAAALTLVSGGCTAALTLVSGQTVPRKGSFFQSEGAEISCAERAPPKRQFLSIRGAEISCAARDFPPKRQFLSIRGAEFSCAARDSPTKRKIFKNRGGGGRRKCLQKAVSTLQFPPVSALFQH